MPKTLRYKDGFSDHDVELRDEVKRLQRTLKQLGFDVDVDGLFGNGTEQAVKSFQRQNGLTADGIVGSKTWAGLNKAKKRGDLRGFHGDLSWVHAREGHAGKAYWPGGASGVTLDPVSILATPVLRSFRRPTEVCWMITR